MKKLKARYIWISVGISFLIAIGLLVGVTFTQGVWTQVCIVLIAIVFIYMTLAIQMASVKTFRYKPKPKNYPKRIYQFPTSDIDEIIKKKGYKPRVEAYGMNYLKVDKTNAYKIVIIRDCEKYFAPEEKKTNSPQNKSLEKCKKFIGFEIFLDVNEDTLRKLPDFNLQGNNVYYSGLYVEEGKLICPNYIEPTAEFTELYNQIKNDLELRDFEEAEPEKLD